VEFRGAYRQRLVQKFERGAFISHPPDPLRSLVAVLYAIC
jgi:hypothetical protein